MKTIDEIKSTRRLKSALVLFFVLLLFGSASYVTAAPIASFISSQTTGNAPLGVQYTDTSTGGPMVNWTWNFKDGTPPVTVQNASHSFETAGTYNVELVVWNATETSSAYQSVTVFPFAQFTANSTTGYAPLTVQFTDTSTGGPMVNWTWKFGDAGNVSYDKNPLYTFYRSGVYTVNLTSMKNGLTNTSANMIITVNPQADFTINPSTGNVSNTFQFNGTSTGTPVVNYTWNYGDGVGEVIVAPGSTNNRTHDYTVAKTYYPNLTVIGRDGTNSGVITKSLPVSPVARFTVSASNPVEGRPVSFYDTSLGDIKNQDSGTGTWFWEFGDGTTSTLQNTTHIYKAGKYSAKLTVTKNGLSDFTTMVINADSGNLYLLRSGINGNTYYFKANKYGIYLPLQNSIRFTAYPTRSMSRFLSDQQSIGTTYEWKFYGANTGTILEPPIETDPVLIQSFTIPDIYTVQLKVKDSRETYTVTKPRLVVVRGTGVTENV